MPISNGLSNGLSKIKDNKLMVTVAILCIACISLLIAVPFVAADAKKWRSCVPNTSIGAKEGDFICLDCTK